MNMFVQLTRFFFSFFFTPRKFSIKWESETKIKGEKNIHTCTKKDIFSIPMPHNTYSEGKQNKTIKLKRVKYWSQ